jgi:NADPH:quinone reductase-like Zn-dependent oxidoreductase
LELAGTVVACGRGVERFSAGDDVMALVGGGAQAEVAVFSERLAMPKPRSVPWTEAGGFAEAFVTAHDALFTQCRLTVGDRVLVHGAAGGVGTAAVQLAVAAGAVVTATVRDEGIRPRVADLGALVLPPDGFVEARPFDIVLELATVENIADNLRSLATGGRISVIGLGSTGSIAPIDLAVLARRRGAIVASTLCARTVEGRAVAVRRVEQHVLPLLSSCRIRVPLTATCLLEEAADAYARFRAGAKFGKVVIDVAPGDG